MKSKDFAQLLTEAAQFAGDGQVRQDLNELANAFDVAGSATVATTLKRAVVADAGIPTGRLLPYLRQIQSFLALAGKPGVTKDLAEVVGVIQRYPLVAFPKTSGTKRAAKSPRARAASTPFNSDLVDNYNNELNGALGNEAGFSAIFAKLESDARIRPAELKELSRLFAGAPGKTKAESLRKIWNRHQSLLVSRAKDRAMAGRSAA